MKTIEILGTGCAKCQNLSEKAEEAAQALQLEYTLKKVTDLNDIMTYGVLITPALVVNGEVKVVGKVPSVEEIKKLLVS